MSWRNLAVPAAIVLLADAWLLMRAAGNRSGEPQATIELTERELNLIRDDQQTSALRLRLTWYGPRGYPPETAADWFDQRKLAELGISSEQAEARRSRPRPVYVALEYDGEAARQRDQGANPLPECRVGEWVCSRLVAVDAALDPAALRRRYPDRARYLILRAEARAISSGGGSRPRQVRGALQLLIGEIYVPRDRDALSDLAAAPGGPRYAVRLSVGSRYEPWVAGVRRRTP